MDIFNYDVVRSKSAAAAGLCQWVISTVDYFKASKVVQPKIARKNELDELIKNHSTKF